MSSDGSKDGRRPDARPTAIEIHNLPGSMSLSEVRTLVGQVATVLQVIAALDGSENGVALLFLSSPLGADSAVQLLDGYSLRDSYLHVKRADGLPNSLINLLFSLDQPGSDASQQQRAAESQANVAAAAAYLEQQQLLNHAEARRARQAQEAQAAAWDSAQRVQQQRSAAAAAQAQAQAAASQQQQQRNNSWDDSYERQQQFEEQLDQQQFDQQYGQEQQHLEQQQQQFEQQMQNGTSRSASTKTYMQQNGSGISYAQQQQQLEADLRQLQMDHNRQHAQQQQQMAAAAAASAAMHPQQHGQQQQQHRQQQQQQQRPAMSWASAAAAAPSLAALTAAANRPQTVAASLAGAGLAGSNHTGGGSGSFQSSEEWQSAVGRGRTGRRTQLSTDDGSGSAGRAGSSISSGSPRPALRSNGRRSEDKVSRPGGQDGASADPTTKLWLGGIDGGASAETVRGVFGRFGPIYDYELQPATHEKGRTDQWGFVNYKRLADAMRAYESLMGEVIPELTGTRKLKLQFRPVDNRRPGSRR